MELTVWLAFVAASTVLVLIPGPTVLLVLGYGLGEGRRIAVPTALGVAAGDLVAMTLSLLGLGAIILASSLAFTTLKWIGAAYLVYLGFKMILGASNTAIELKTSKAGLSPRTAFFNAGVVTALNPKSIAFFIAFVPQFINPEAAFAPQAAILIASFVALGGLNALAYALAASQLRHVIARPSVLAWMTRAGGAMLVAMGVATASLKRATS